MRSIVARLAKSAVLVLALTLSAISIPPQKFPPTAQAAVPHVFDQFSQSFGFDRDEVSDNNRLAQSFVASDNYLATEIRLFIMDVGTVDTANLTLTSDVDPPGPDLPLSFASAQGTTAGVEWVSFILDTPWTLDASSTYWIILDSPGQQNQGYEWAKKISTPTNQLYPNGMAASCAGGGCGNWNLNPLTDYLFIVIGLMGPSIGCSIDVDSTSAGAGDPLNYTVLFDNIGTEYASVVWINMSLSGNLTYISDNSGSLTSAPSWTFQNVNIGPHSFDMTAKVGLGVYDGYVLKVNLTLQYADRFGNLQEDHSCEAETIARVPSLSFSKSVFPQYATQGGNLIFTLTFTNSGSRPASKVWINDTVLDPAIYSYDTAQYGTGPGNTTNIFLKNTSSLNVYSYEFGNVSPGVYRFEIYVTVRIDAKNGTEIVNRATLNYTDSSRRICGPIWASATARIMGASIHVRSFVLDTPVAPDDIVRYQIVFNNEGTAQSAFTWINVTLPVGVTYQSVAGLGTSFYQNWTSGRTRHYNFTNVWQGPHDFMITVKVDSNVVDGQVLASSVCLAYTDWDSSLLLSSCDSSSAIVMIPTMALDVTGVSTADPGDFLDYQVYLNNSGSGVAKFLWVNITWDTNLIYIFDDSDTVGGKLRDKGSWQFDGVKPGNILWTFNFEIKPGLDDGHIITSYFDAVYTDYKGRPSGVMSESVSTSITAPIVRVDLIQNKTKAPRNDLIVYTIFYNNTGSGTAASVWINDTIPDITEFKSSSDQYVGSSGVRLTWHFTGVAPGPHSMTLTVRVDGQAAVDSTLLNSVEMQYEDANGNSVGQGSVSVSAVVIDGNVFNDPDDNPPTLFTNLLWILVVVLLLLLMAMWLFVGRKFYGLGLKNKARIDELFLLHRSGELIRHHSRSLRPEVDSDVLSAMLVAVQSFVKESFKFRAGDLEELKFGDQKIVLINGAHVIIAAVVSGPFPQRTVPAMRKAIDEIENRFGLKLDEWSGLTEDLPQIDDVLSLVFQNGNGK